MKPRMRRGRIFLTLAILVLTVASPWWLSIFFPWSPINCERQDIDIQTGRVRYTRYFLFMQLSRRVQDSSITATLDPQSLRDQPEWRRVNTFSPGVRHSPHYAFHGAFFQVRQLELIWKVGKFSDAAKRASAQRILDLWQQAGSDEAAKAYILALSDIAFEKEKTVQKIEERDLPE